MKFFLPMLKNLGLKELRSLIMCNTFRPDLIHQFENMSKICQK